jgi:hypothetical protein
VKFGLFLDVIGLLETPHAIYDLCQLSSKIWSMTVSHKSTGNWVHNLKPCDLFCFM